MSSLALIESSAQVEHAEAINVLPSRDVISRIIGGSDPRLSLAEYDAQRRHVGYESHKADMRPHAAASPAVCLFSVITNFFLFCDCIW